MDVLTRLAETVTLIMFYNSLMVQGQLINPRVTTIHSTIEIDAICIHIPKYHIADLRNQAIYYLTNETKFTT